MGPQESNTDIIGQGSRALAGLGANARLRTGHIYSHHPGEIRGAGEENETKLKVEPKFKRL